MLNKLFKKGQGMPLNVIIIAAICLFVLVILILIFTGRIAWFEKGLGGEAEQELRVMQASYGDCHPNVVAERSFLSVYNSYDDSQEFERPKLIVEFRNVVSECKTVDNSVLCKDFRAFSGTSSMTRGCAWQ